MDNPGAFQVRQIALAVLVLGLAGPGTRAQSSPQVVELRTVEAAEAAHPGSSLKVAVLAQIAPGYHVNDHQPTLDYLIPTELKLEPAKPVGVAKVVYPKGRMKGFAFSQTQLSVYEGTLAVGALLKVARAAAPGSYALKGQFTYQACNDHACLPPKSLPVTVTVKVVGRGTPVKRVNADVFRNVQFD